MTMKRNATDNLSQPSFLMRAAIPTLGVIGMGISGYLTYLHYSDAAPVCLPLAPCTPVLSSQYASVWGISLSIFGLLMFALLTGLGIWMWKAKDEKQALLALVTYSLALTGTIFYAYLFYLELRVIHAFCTWCIISSLVMLSTLVLAVKVVGVMGKYINGVPRFVRNEIKRYVQW